MLQVTIFTLFSLALFTDISISARTANQGPASEMQLPADINISPDQVQKMESAFEQIQNVYASLPPEEQREFEKELEKAVQDEQKKLAAMSPAQQKEYVENAFKAFDEIEMGPGGAFDDGDWGQEFIPAPIPELEAPTEKNKTKTKAAEDQTQQKKIEEMVRTIDNALKLLESFKTKIGTLKPSAQYVIDKWITSGYIQKWAGDASNWNLFHTKLEAFVQRLYKLKDKDIKTGKYKFLSDPKLTGALLGQLKMILQTLRGCEPNIEIIDGKAANDKAKQAIRKLVNYLVDTPDTIITESDKLLKKFEPEALKMRKEEERKTKEAEIYQKTKLRKRPKRAVEIGTKDNSRYNDYDDYLQEYYGDYASAPRYSRTSPRTGRYETPRRNKDSKPTAGPSKKTGTPAKEQATQKAKPVKKRKTPLLKPADAKSYTKTPELDRWIGEFGKALGGFAEKVEDDEQSIWKSDNLQKHIEKGSKSNKIQSELEESVIKLRKAYKKQQTIVKKIKGLKDKKAQDGYTSKLKEEFNKYKNVLGQAKKAIAKVKFATMFGSAKTAYEIPLQEINTYINLILKVMK